MAFKKNQIEINQEFEQALDLIEKSNENVFITGKAGTGKSTLLQYFREKTKKEIVILAPTGVAALNVKGQTIHSFFKFKPDINISKVKKIKNNNSIYKKVKTIIIDEISMVRADLFDCVDKFLRLNRGKNIPFGGVQMVFIGDLYQLPPVVTYAEKEIFKNFYETPYFFSSKVFEELDIKIVELEKVYRQKDQSFVNLLNLVRNNSITDKELKILNSRFDPEFEPDSKDFYIHLTPTKKLSALINERELAKLDGEEFAYEALLSGEFELNHLPTSQFLKFKKGAQVMMLNNDSTGRWVNGTIGIIQDDPDAPDTIWVELQDGEVAGVTPNTWELFNYHYDVSKGHIESEVIGACTQYPMQLAWSVTIHKSQGKTFDRVIIDVGSGTFAHGQMYVALSRCTSFEGTVLRKAIEKRHIFVDWKIVNFLTKYRYKLSEKEMSLEDKTDLISRVIKKGGEIEILYLKTNDEKSTRVVKPISIGEFDYNGKKFFGVIGFCRKRGEERVFKVERILKIASVGR